MDMSGFEPLPANWGRGTVIKSLLGLRLAYESTGTDPSNCSKVDPTFGIPQEKRGSNYITA